MILGLKLRPIINDEEEKVIIFGVKVLYDVSFSFEYLILVLGNYHLRWISFCRRNFAAFVDQIGEFSLIFVLEKKKIFFVWLLGKFAKSKRFEFNIY